METIIKKRIFCSLKTPLIAGIPLEPNKLQRKDEINLSVNDY